VTLKAEQVTKELLKISVKDNGLGLTEEIVKILS
jgi:signal transduction histidine kinase